MTSKYDLTTEQQATYLAAWDALLHSTQDELLEWFNVREEDVDDEDRARLAFLEAEGEFLTYACAHCGERVRQASPADWNHFQGVRQDEGCGSLCADCYALYEQLRAYAG